MIKNISIFLAIILLAGCSVAQLEPAAAHVRLTANPVVSQNCEYLGEVIGTEGHWYTFLFIANETLMQAALDDLRNKAAAKGANLVHLDDPHQFGTSVTLLGLAYKCKK